MRRYRSNVADEQHHALYRQDAWDIILSKRLLMYGGYQ